MVAAGTGHTHKSTTTRSRPLTEAQIAARLANMAKARAARIEKRLTRREIAPLIEGSVPDPHKHWGNDMGFGVVATSGGRRRGRPRIPSTRQAPGPVLDRRRDALQGAA